MSHPIHRVTGFGIVGPYTLKIAFADGTEQRIDFKPVLQGSLYGPLQDLATFNTVRLDTEVGTLVWPNDAMSVEITPISAWCCRCLRLRLGPGVDLETGAR
jgi:hypothetical protein